MFRSLLGAKREFVFAAGRGILKPRANEAEADLVGWIPRQNEPGAEGVARRHRDIALQTQLTAIYHEARDVDIAWSLRR